MNAATPRSAWRWNPTAGTVSSCPRKPVVLALAILLIFSGCAAEKQVAQPEPADKTRWVCITYGIGDIPEIPDAWNLLELTSEGDGTSGSWRWSSTSAVPIQQASMGNGHIAFEVHKMGYRFEGDISGDVIEGACQHIDLAAGKLPDHYRWIGSREPMEPSVRGVSGLWVGTVQDIPSLGDQPIQLKLVSMPDSIPGLFELTGMQARIRSGAATESDLSFEIWDGTVHFQARVFSDSMSGVWQMFDRGTHRQVQSGTWAVHRDL